MTRPAQAWIDLQALQANLAKVREYAPASRVMAVVKSNAYGHGLLAVAEALSDADAFGVACIEEASVLRRGGCRKPIVLLEGLFEASELDYAATQDLQLVVHTHEQIQILAQGSDLPPLTVWVKIDTGMRRLGFSPEQAVDVAAALRSLPVVGELRWMTHLAKADDPADLFTKRQLDRFYDAVQDTQDECSVANSAALIAFPQARCQWVRPGVMLYGVSPFVDGTGPALGLQAVMSLSTRLIAVKTCRKGEAVGYGGTWVCPQDMPVGIAAIGYGDGYPRHAPSGTPVLVNGERAHLIGRVSMDMICLDLRNQPQAQRGDPVVLWGKGLAVEEVARAAGTIAYELLCHVTPRVHMTHQAYPG